MYNILFIGKASVFVMPCLDCSYFICHLNLHWKSLKKASKSFALKILDEVHESNPVDPLVKLL
jgi:hypothetical protein